MSSYIHFSMPHPYRSWSSVYRPARPNCIALVLCRECALNICSRERKWGASSLPLGHSFSVSWMSSFVNSLCSPLCFPPPFLYSCALKSPHLLSRSPSPLMDAPVIDASSFQTCFPCSSSISATSSRFPLG